MTWHPDVRGRGAPGRRPPPGWSDEGGRRPAGPPSEAATGTGTAEPTPGWGGAWGCEGGWRREDRGGPVRECGGPDEAGSGGGRDRRRGGAEDEAPELPPEPDEPGRPPVSPARRAATASAARRAGETGGLPGSSGSGGDSGGLLVPQRRRSRPPPDPASSGRPALPYRSSRSSPRHPPRGPRRPAPRGRRRRPAPFAASLGRRPAAFRLRRTTPGAGLTRSSTSGHIRMPRHQLAPRCLTRLPPRIA